MSTEKKKRNGLIKYRGMKLNRKIAIIMLVLVLVPSSIFTVLTYKSIERRGVEGSANSLSFTINRCDNEIISNVSIIESATDFTLTDSNLTGLIDRIFQGHSLLYVNNPYNMSITNLERMVESNPDIYKLRLYINSVNITETPPILYNYESMYKLPWADTDEIGGWVFGYVDTNVDSSLLNTSQRNAAYITPIKVTGSGIVGYLEVAVTMNTLFPDIYNSDENTVVLFRDNDGNIYSSDSNAHFAADVVSFLDNKEDWNWNKSVQAFDPGYETAILVETKYVPELGGSIIGVYDMEDTIGTLRSNRNMYLLGMLIMAVVLSVAINSIVKRLFAKFYKILDSIRLVQDGDLSVRVGVSGNDEIGELGTQIDKMLDRIRALMEENVTRERLAKNSEIRVLQNQINAHFIYNVLESIKMMAEIDEKYDISDAITSLGRLLRYSMHWTSGTVTVGEELDYVKNYLALINLRFDYEIYLSLNIPDLVLKQQIPKMSLQPIVENAIYHGIEQIAENTNIYVKGKLENSEVILEVTDAGKGMTEEQVEKLMDKIHGKFNTDETEKSYASREGGGHGIGLKNVEDRIHMNFGDSYGLTVNSKLGVFTKVQLRVPQTFYEIDEKESK
ncbi:MAG: histidine kinase [Lachnospiraceae bacterium]|nr:histidine kinase [Lachnospiraceae bacterium]